MPDEVADNPTPRSLVSRARHGDREALEHLLLRGRRRLEGITRARMGTKLQARLRTSDIVQSAYAQALEGFDHFDGETDRQFDAWMALILENKIRKKGRYFDALCRRDADSAPTPDPPDPSHASPSVALADREDLEAVCHALDALPATFRDVLVDRILDGLSFEEIAARTGARPETCRTRLWRARRLLQEALANRSRHTSTNPG